MDSAKAIIKNVFTCKSLYKCAMYFRQPIISRLPNLKIEKLEGFFKEYPLK